MLTPRVPFLHECIEQFVMQTKNGSQPQGFIAEEYQEFLRLVILPACSRVARANFDRPETRKLYGQFVADLEWNVEVMGPAYLLSADRDKRHSLTDYARWRAESAETSNPALHSRIEYAVGERRWIDLSPVQLLPSASCVADTIQQPIEVCMSFVKRAARKKLPNDSKPGGVDLCEAVVLSAEGLDCEKILNMVKHAEKAILVWASTEQTVVTVQLHNGGKSDDVKFAGTHGGFVHKILRA